MLRWEKRKILFVRQDFCWKALKHFLHTFKWPIQAYDESMFKDFMKQVAKNDCDEETFDKKIAITWKTFDEEGILAECSCAVNESGEIEKLYRGDVLYRIMKVV